MTIAEVQIHGYRKGHQLLASSIVLSKEDQAVVDRLSDVAGPLRPKEQFAPYLSAYPLPSGIYYVVARTWQDYTVSRAGCVLTKSVLIAAQAWASKPLLNPILHLLDPAKLPSEQDAACIELGDQLEESFPSVSNFNASELLEALFLEDTKPVVVFDAPDAEVVASRIFAALWPDLRRRFTLSTFALSPRKVGGHDFDLIFAPSNAKAKFSGWTGRRVDGRSMQNGRHKWTDAIVRSVFEEPVPSLLSDQGVELLGGQLANNVAALRIVLLWDELLDKLDRTPSAALGLLDIANSGLINNAAAVRVLEPRLTEAMRGVKRSLSPSDAWDFLSAIVRKMQGHHMPAGRLAVEQLAVYLAEQEPDGAVNLLRQPDPKGGVGSLIPSIAIGLGNGAVPRVEQLLFAAPADIIARLVSHGGTLANRVATDDGLIKRMGVVLTEVDRELADKAGMQLLPFLIEDRQIAAAMPIFSKLNAQGVAEELRWLGEVNDFQAQQLCALLVDQAREVGGLSYVRDALISSNPSTQRDAILELALEPVVEDISWLLDEKRLVETTSAVLLVSLLQRADDMQFTALLSDRAIGERAVASLPDSAVEIRVRAMKQDSLPMNAYINVLCSLLPKVDNTRKLEIARYAIARCLRNRFDGDESEILLMLLGILGAQLDAGWAVVTGLERCIDAEVASRNLIAFDKAPLAARERIVTAVDEVARALRQRNVFDLTEEANDSCANLMFSAENTSYQALIDAAGSLVPSLLWARSKPVSLMVAALFPILYREFEKSDAVPDLLRFFPLLDWNRCKTARAELVDAFMSSSWKAGDLALTAWRCNDLDRILKRVAKSYNGWKYLTQIENDLGRLDEDCRFAVKGMIPEIRSNTYK